VITNYYKFYSPSAELIGGRIVLRPNRSAAEPVLHRFYNKKSKASKQNTILAHYALHTNNVNCCNAYGVLGWNDPILGAERPRNRGGTTAFGADVGRIDSGAD